ncbi:type II toxin-antitoxin system HicA family toxin [Aquiflexum sp.]|uniref:type II toxin-antitoxin system HicA family toxin n=1 Tax=Aquiflexum sp. TaxID=1872584 RepID=UPI00359315E3
MKASFLISILEKAGWQKVRKQGSHYILTHPNHPNLLSIPELGEQSLKPILINNIFREAGLKGRMRKIQLSPKRIVTVVKNLLGLSR